LTIDLASELGNPETLAEYYQGLLLKVSRDLGLDIDIDDFWQVRSDETVNQKLLRFFRQIIADRIADPIVVFLDEIDSTLKLPYTDDLFTAIRGMYNERQLVPA
jgi:AAA-like domain